VVLGWVGCQHGARAVGDPGLDRATAIRLGSGRAVAGGATPGGAGPGRAGPDSLRCGPPSRAGLSQASRWPAGAGVRAAVLVRAVLSDP